MPERQIHVTVRGLDDLIDYVCDVRVNGIPRAQRALDRVLKETGDVSRDLAHEHEGALKASMWTQSEHGVTEWTGSVNYSARGGIFELQRGEDHASYIERLTAISESRIEEALNEVFRRE